MINLFDVFKISFLISIMIIIIIKQMISIKNVCLFSASPNYKSWVIGRKHIWYLLYYESFITKTKMKRLFPVRYLGFYHENAHWWCHQTATGGMTSPVQFHIKFYSHLHSWKSAQSSNISIDNIDSMNLNHIDPKHSLTSLVALTFKGTEGFVLPLMSAGENSSGSAPKFRNSESPLGGSEAGSWLQVLRDSRSQFRAHFWTDLRMNVLIKRKYKRCEDETKL